MLTKTNPPPQFAFINISSCSPILFRQKALVIQNYFCIFTPNMQIMDNSEVIYYFINKNKGLRSCGWKPLHPKGW